MLKYTFNNDSSSVFQDTADMQKTQRNQNTQNLENIPNNQNTLIPANPITELEDGFLIVHVVTESGDINMPGVTVRIYNESVPQKLLQTFTTDVLGNTPRITLPAPARKYALDKASIIVTFSSYTLEIIFKGYFIQVYTHIQVFADTESVHVCKMIPLPAGLMGVQQLVYEKPPYELIPSL
jgi:hypothetical protein